MTVMELGALGEFIGSILMIATLIYLAIQVRQNTARQKRDASVSIQHGQNGVVALLQDPVMARAYARTAEYGLAAPIEDQSRAVNFVLLFTLTKRYNYALFPKRQI